MAKLKATKNVTKKKEDAIAGVVDQIEAESMRTLNTEIEIGEDGIVHDVPLLAGYIDENGTLHSTFSYREMTGKDEEALNKGDVRANGGKLVNVLCERCVVQIGTLTKKDVGQVKWGQIIRSMLGGDLDYMAFKIREVSKGSEVWFSHKCPDCGAKLRTAIKCSEFPIKPFMGQYQVEFSLFRGYKDRKGNVYTEGVCRLPNGADREIVYPYFKKNASTATSLLMTRLVSFGEGVMVTQNDISEMSLRDRGIIEDIMKDNAFGISMDGIDDIVCTNCGTLIDGSTGQTDFL